MKKPPFKNDGCHYDYANKCDCSEDDKCGCSFPNNIAHDYSSDCFNQEDDLSAAAQNNTAETGTFTSFFYENTATSHLNAALDYTHTPAIGTEAPDFTAPAILNDDTMVEHFNFYKYTQNQNTVLFFYPEDFSFTCPSELLMLNKNLPAFAKRDTKILGISTDSVYSHLAWKQLPPVADGIADISFPLIADLDKHISKHYGILNKKETARRATFIIDKQKIIRHMAIYDAKLWRSPEEIIRILDIINHKTDDITACPRGWKQNFFFERPEPETMYEMFSHREDQ